MTDQEPIDIPRQGDNTNPPPPPLNLPVRQAPEAVQETPYPPQMPAQQAPYPQQQPPYPPQMPAQQAPYSQQPYQMPYAAPGQQPIQQVVVNNNTNGPGVIGVRGPNHVLHLILTVVTVGLWLPVWLVIAIRNTQKPVYG